MTVYVDWLNCFYFLSSLHLFEVLNFRDKFFIALVFEFAWEFKNIVRLLSPEEFIRSVGNNSTQQQTDRQRNSVGVCKLYLFQFPSVNWRDEDYKIVSR